MKESALRKPCNPHRIVRLARFVCFCFLSLPYISAFLGCGGSKVSIPKANPEELTRLAMDQYDTDQDGAIGGDELKQAASLASAMIELDADGDGRIVAEDISYAITSWNASGTSLAAANCTVTKGRKPLAGAKVTFEPESFHEGKIPTVSGICGEDGSVSLLSDAAKSQGLSEGIPIGFYKVRISLLENGKEKLPAKYNTETTLGRAVSPNGRGTTIDFRL